jgi:tRNA threonylcarbamoyladenosine biosynthesis protein TsaE
MTKITLELELNNLDELINHIKTFVKSKPIVLLSGDLASGKTTLVKAYVKSCNINDAVTSPTFCLQNCYGEDIYHYDIYNKTFDEFVSLGLFDELDKSGTHFVEWASDELITKLDDFGFDYFKIEIQNSTNNDKRTYKIEA